MGTAFEHDEKVQAGFKLPAVKRTPQGRNNLSKMANGFPREMGGGLGGLGQAGERDDGDPFPGPEGLRLGRGEWSSGSGLSAPCPGLPSGRRNSSPRSRRFRAASTSRRVGLRVALGPALCDPRPEPGLGGAFHLLMEGLICGTLRRG